MTEPRLPDALRREVARSLTPVRPHATPGRRALLFLLIGVLLLAAVPQVWGVRENAAALGLELWAWSLVQIAAAVLLFRAALTESVPGQLSPRGRATAWVGAAVALVLGVTTITYATYPTYVPPAWSGPYLYVCSTRTFALGLPALIVAGLLLGRGLTLRPALAGALAGLGAGLLSDSAWRVYCEVSDPRHVLSAHTSAVLALSALGALAGEVVRRVRQKRHHNTTH